MTQERWFRGADEAAAFDWYRSARDLDVPVEIARTLYARAMQVAADSGRRRAEDLYLRWLRDAARAQSPAPASRAPGRQTRVLHEAKPPELPELAALGPGRWTRTLFERDDAEASAGPDGQRDGQLDGQLVAVPSTASSEREPGGPLRLPVAMRERMERAYGQTFDDVELHRDSAEVPAGQQAFARGRHIHFERGAFDPASAHGEHVVAHELAHVAQQSHPASHGDRPATRATLEADAHQAALSALAGQAAMVRFAAPAQVALGFSHGATSEPASAGGEAPSVEAAAPAPAARTALPGFAGAAQLRELLLAAAARGRGAADALAAADPATATATLRELRNTYVSGQAAPALQLVARAADGEATRVLGRGSEGAALPDDIAVRLRPHVGSDAASAARLHTDDLADLVAAAHHARAVTLGAEIYFARGEYAPGTERGDELLAHELTHVAQGQRGELARAAAKGLESGGNLDPSEAEADLRAKLAVIQLHPSDAAPPPLAAPSGQPTSDGDRAARIAAQQQRITLAEAPALPLATPPAPAASSPQAPVVHPPPPMTAAPAPARTGNAYVDTFAAPPSKQATELWGKAGEQATTQAAADQAKFDGALPPMPVLLDGGNAGNAKGGGGGAAGQKQPPAAGVVPPAATPTPTPAPPPITTAATAAKALQPTADKATIKADGQKVIDNLPTSSPDVKTDPGPAPVTDLAGQADPVRTLGDQQHAVGEGAKALDDARSKIVSGPGAAQVQPVKLDEKLSVPKEQAAGPMPALPPVDGMAKLKKWNLPTDVQASFDTIAKPKMDASLAQGKAKMLEAETKRDADRTKAVSDAQDKVKQAHADADKQQQAKVADTRTQIANKQADTLVKQETEVKKLDQQSSDKKKGAISKINDRVQADQAKVETDYKGAQQKAEDQKKQGEADAAKKKKEAEDKKKDESWWDKAADAVCDGIKAIADEIDKALDAIGKAIGDLLDAVKDAACKVIDAARDFVCQALTEFGDWLKSAVTALIGQVFPQLAAELNALIDQAVNAAKAAVNAIADVLKKAVTALCDSLKAAIDAAIAAFKAAVQAAATFAQALVTGDWSLVGKMILEGILKLLGIDPAAFYALIGKAEDSIEKIIENPGAFVGHLIDAVKLGFKQFGANFLTHLKNGVVQWLFGTFAEAGITMPASFDVAGIFDLVCQVLGLTWPRLRPKVVKIIGEKNTKRLEFVEKYIEALVTGGFHGLWDKIQQDMSSLWDMVIGGVKSWLIEKIVQQAIIKIATMWNPAGAIIQLIETAWNVYQWVKENAQRIFGLVQAVVDSVSNIVAGNIGGAANFIEASLAKLVPIAISLFADLIGLGGIADKVKGIIEKVQDTIDKAIDKLIARVMAMFKGKDGDDGKDGKDGKTGDHSVGETIAFEAAGHPHKLWFEVKGTQATLMVASTPIAVSAHLDHMTGQLDKLPDDKKGGAQSLIGQAKTAEAKATAEANKATTGDGNAKDSADGKTADSDEHTVAGLLKQLFEIFEGLNAEDLKAACDKDGGMAKTKFGQVMAEAEPGAAGARASFLAGANVRLKTAPTKPLDAMRNEVSESGDKYILKGTPIPTTEIVGTAGISRVLDLPSVFNYYLRADYKASHGIVTEDDFVAACAAGKFNPKTDLDDSKEIRGKVAESWWFAKAQAGGVTLGQIKKDLTVMDTTYDKGMLRLNISAGELTAANIALHKPTAFDGLMQGWGNDPMWTAAPGDKWGLTRDGMHEGVIKASTLGAFKDRVLILPEPKPVIDEVPKVMVESAPATVTQPTDNLVTQLAAASSGQVIHTTGASDPKAATKALLAAHPDAKMEGSTLNLPPVQVAAVQGADSLAALGSAVSTATGVSSVSVEKTGEGEADIIGHINPTAKAAKVASKPLKPDQVEKVGGARLDKVLFPAWQDDALKSGLTDKTAAGSEIKIWDPSFKLAPLAATARADAITMLQGEAKLAGAPRTETALAEALENKSGPIKNKLQTTAGGDAAKAIATYGVGRATTPALKTEIPTKVGFENNLQTGRINMPGTGEVPHTLYEPDDTTWSRTPEGTGWRISFSYKAPYQDMHFSVLLDKNEMVQEAEGFNLTLKQSDGTRGRGKMSQSPGHQPNADMHNAHVIADMIRGSGYKKAHNLVSTSSTYNLNEMSSAETEVANFVNRIDGSAPFDLKIKVEWSKADSNKSVNAILKENPTWQGETKANVQAALAKYLSGFGSKLQRVMKLQYDCTVHADGSDEAMDTVERGPDVYLGV